jgi:16S rRNA (cytidine1402-2'-O)-methyltransferase
VGTLHLVATPIGNLEDVTLRALRVLREAELILAEDTRHTRGLLERHGISAELVSLHGHNEQRRSALALAALARGADVALVSDAGTPLVSDPGERLVRAALDAGHAVSAVPGPSAVLAALVASGIATGRFSFIGFPPRRAGERKALFASLRGRAETLVFFESPRRIAATLRELSDALGARRACVARELTKLHEELARDTLDALAARFADGARGEVTLVVGGAPEPAAAAADSDLVDAAIRARAAAGGSASEIARDVARATGAPRSAVYERVVESGRR